MTRFPYPIAWRRQGARCHYAGELLLDGSNIVLTGREPSTGVEEDLRIPDYAVRELRRARCDEEEVVGVRGFVLDVADAVPLFLRAVGVGPLHEDALGLALGRCLHRDVLSRPAA